jgi:hypothetical protein
VFVAGLVDEGAARGTSSRLVAARAVVVVSRSDKNTRPGRCTMPPGRGMPRRAPGRVEGGVSATRALVGWSVDLPTTKLESP